MNNHFQCKIIIIIIIIITFTFIKKNLITTPNVEFMTIPIPKDLSSQYDGPSKEVSVARHVSRFRQWAQETPGMS